MFIWTVRTILVSVKFHFDVYISIKFHIFWKKLLVEIIVKMNEDIGSSVAGSSIKSVSVTSISCVWPLALDHGFDIQSLCVISQITALLISEQVAQTASHGDGDMRASVALSHRLSAHLSEGPRSAKPPTEPVL